MKMKVPHKVDTIFLSEIFVLISGPFGMGCFRDDKSPSPNSGTFGIFPNIFQNEETQNPNFILADFRDVLGKSRDEISQKTLWF